jgi:hypothetical protein
VTESFAFGFAANGAGLGSYASCVYPLVTESCGFISCIIVTAIFAHINGITAVGAIGICNTVYNVVVAGSINNFLLTNNEVATRAVQTFGKTVFGTSGVYRCFGNHIVTESRYFFLGNDDFLALRAVLTFGQTGLCASGSNCLIGYDGVSMLLGSGFLGSCLLGGGVQSSRLFDGVGCCLFVFICAILVTRCNKHHEKNCQRYQNEHFEKSFHFTLLK